MSDTLERMDSLYADNTLVDSYQQKLDELLQKATLSPEEQAQLETIVTYFKTMLTVSAMCGISMLLSVLTAKYT